MIVLDDDMRSLSDMKDIKVAKTEKEKFNWKAPLLGGLMFVTSIAATTAVLKTDFVSSLGSNKKSIEILRAPRCGSVEMLINGSLVKTDRGYRNFCNQWKFGNYTYSNFSVVKFSEDQKKMFELIRSIDNYNKSMWNGRISCHDIKNKWKEIEKLDEGKLEEMRGLVQYVGNVVVDPLNGQYYMVTTEKIGLLRLMLCKTRKVLEKIGVDIDLIETATGGGIFVIGAYATYATLFWFLSLLGIRVGARKGYVPSKECGPDRLDS